MADILHRKFYALIADPAAKNTFPASFEDAQPPVNPPGTGPLGGSKWFDLANGIYYNPAPVVIGRNQEYTGSNGAALLIRSRYDGNDTGATNGGGTFFELRDSNNRVLMSATSGTADGTQLARLQFPTVGATWGGATQLTTGFAFKGNTNTGVGLIDLYNSVDTLLFRFTNNGALLANDGPSSGYQFGTAAATGYQASGIHVGARAGSGARNILRCVSTASVVRMQVWNDGNIDMPSLPTSDPLIAGRLWNDANTLKISAG